MNKASPISWVIISLVLIGSGCVAAPESDQRLAYDVSDEQRKTCISWSGLSSLDIALIPEDPDGLSNARNSLESQCLEAMERGGPYYLSKNVVDADVEVLEDTDGPFYIMQDCRTAGGQWWGGALKKHDEAYFECGLDCMIDEGTGESICSEVEYTSSRKAPQ